MMAFFNLTQLGAQDPFKIASSSNYPSPGAAHAQKTQEKPVLTEAQASSSQSTTDERAEKPVTTAHSSVLKIELFSGPNFSQKA